MTSTGVKSWIYMYRVGRRLRRWTLGRYPALSLADARKRAKIASADLLKDSPVDPAAGKAEARGALTIGELALDYLEQHAKPKKLTWKADQWMLEKDVLPVWKHVPVQDVTRQMISERLWTIANTQGRNAPQSALHVRRLLSTMFEFAIARDIYGLEHNPVTRAAVPAKATSRNRVLTDDEMVALWKALDEEWRCGHALTASWLRLILLTLQRPGEVLRMEWHRVDLANGWWSLEHTKPGHPIEVALSPLAVSVLKNLDQWSRGRHDTIEKNMIGRRESRERSRWVFPSRTRANGDEPMQSMLFKACERVRQRAGISFKPHDLRRTSATLLGKLGVDRFMVKRVLNHADSSVTGVYDRYAYQPQKMSAVTSLGVYIDALTVKAEGQRDCCDGPPHSERLIAPANQM